MDSPSLIKSEYYHRATGNQKVSRYKYLRRITNESGDSYIETPEKLVIPESKDDVYYSVEPGKVNRLDAISNMFYGTQFLWWAIAYVNHLDNPFDVASGLVLRIPSYKNIPV